MKVVEPLEVLGIAPFIWQEEDALSELAKRTELDIKGFLAQVGPIPTSTLVYFVCDKGWTPIALIYPFKGLAKML